MIYLNVYSDPKMSEQICIELKEKLGKIGLSGKISFYKIDTSIFATFLLERFSILSVYIYIFLNWWLILSLENILDYNLIKRQQSSSKDLSDGFGVLPWHAA